MGDSVRSTRHCLFKRRLVTSLEKNKQFEKWSLFKFTFPWSSKIFSLNKKMRSFQKFENFPSWSPASSLKSVRFAELKIQQILAWKEKKFFCTSTATTLTSTTTTTSAPFRCIMKTLKSEPLPPNFLSYPEK